MPDVETLWQKVLDLLKKGGTFIEKNKEIIGGLCLFIADKLPKDSPYYWAALILGVLLTGKGIMQLKKDGELKTAKVNGKKTLTANAMLAVPQLGGIFVFFIIPGIILFVIGAVHKIIKKKENK